MYVPDISVVISSLDMDPPVRFWEVVISHGERRKKTCQRGKKRNGEESPTESFERGSIFSPVETKDPLPRYVFPPDQSLRSGFTFAGRSVLGYPSYLFLPQVRSVPRSARLMKKFGFGVAPIPLRWISWEL